MIKNRLRFKINYQSDSLTIAIFERQYYTKSGWTDNPLPMSKKQAAKILDPIKQKIEDIINTLPTIVIIKEKKPNETTNPRLKEEEQEEHETTIPKAKGEKGGNLPKITEVGNPEKIKNLDYTPKIVYLGEGRPTPPKPTNSIPENNDSSKSETIKAVSNSTDKQTIISLGNEAMDKITLIEEKIESLQNVVNESNYLKIGTEVQNLKKTIVPIKKEYLKKINSIAVKRTISYNIKKTDPAKYYSTKSITVYGAHWERNYITILLNVSFTRNHSVKRVEIYSGEVKTYEEELRELRFQFQFKENNEVTKHTIPIFNKKTNASFGISFKNFEKETDYVNFNSSLAKDKLIK